MRPAAPIENGRTTRGQLDCLAIVGDRSIKLCHSHTRGSAIIVGGAITWCKGESAVEVPNRLLHKPKREQNVAAVIVCRRVLRKQLNRMIEILKGRPEMLRT